MTAQHPFYAHMLQAAELAKQGQWRTAPNPCVGAVLVRSGKVVAQGYHTAYGAPHAEIAALEDAKQRKVDPSKCTLVVTLEPCHHSGKTPPCTKAILDAGIKHVVIGAMDPNLLAQGGADFLTQHGVRVETAVAGEICTQLIADFTVWQTSSLPYVILKLAGTLDGRIATRSGHSKWISSDESRRQVHILRQHMGAVLVGGNTFHQDDPLLSARDEDGNDYPVQQPLAVIVTTRLPQPDAALQLLQKRASHTHFWTSAAVAASPKAEALRRLGMHVFGLSRLTQEGNQPVRAELNLEEGLTILRRDFNCQHVLCEGGGRLALSLLTKGLIHEFQLHLAPKILGDEQAIPLFTGRSPELMDETVNFRFTAITRNGDDLMLTLLPAPPVATDTATVIANT